MNDAQRFNLFDEADRRSAENIDWEMGPIVSEMESVANKTKAMSVFSISSDMIGGELYCSLLRKSGEMDVLAALHKRTNGSNSEAPSGFFLFFVSREESWRIPAYLSMKAAFHDHDWSDGAEVLEGTLLGYSQSQMKSWISAKRRRRVGWLGPTCYFLMSSSQRAKLKALADRCIDPLSLSGEIEVFYSTDNLPPKVNVHELLPEGTDLCRASIKYQFFRKLFDRDIKSARKQSFFVSAINVDNVSELNSSLQSSFIFFGS